MSFIVDIALIAVFGFLVFRSSRKGFLIGILGVLAWVGASVFASAVSGDVANWIYAAFFEHRVTEWIASKISEVGDVGAVVDAAKSVVASLPGYAVSAAEALGVNAKALVESVASAGSDVGETVTAELTEKVARPIISAALEAVSFMALFFASSAVLHALARVVNKFMKIPGLKQVNRLLGALLGVVKGAAVVFALCVMLNIFMSVGGDSAFSQAVASSRLVTAVGQSAMMLGFTE